MYIQITGIGEYLRSMCTVDERITTHQTIDINVSIKVPTCISCGVLSAAFKKIGRSRTRRTLVTNRSCVESFVHHDLRGPPCH